MAESMQVVVRRPLVLSEVKIRGMPLERPMARYNWKGTAPAVETVLWAGIRTILMPSGTIA